MQVVFLNLHISVTVTVKHGESWLEDHIYLRAFAQVEQSSVTVFAYTSLIALTGSTLAYEAQLECSILLLNVYGFMAQG